MSRNPYEVAGSPPTLRRSVFAFVDILGYQDLLQSAQGQGAQEAQLARLHKALSFSRKWLDDTDGVDKPVGKDHFSLKAFTDNIAIGWPIAGDGEIELGYGLQDLAAFQLTMVNAGFFVRGAVSVGSAYVDEIAVFGDALLEAYEGESSLARDPRIVLTESSREYVKKHLEYYVDQQEAPQNRDVMRDVDGQWFVNYLDAIRIADDGQPAFEALARHKECVESKLEDYRKRPPVFAKYAWTADYHNHFCDLHGFEAYTINIDSFAGERGFIVDDGNALG